MARTTRPSVQRWKQLTIVAFAIGRKIPMLDRINWFSQWHYNRDSRIELNLYR